jgi:mitochondrial pyruvate carrier 2
MTSTASAATAAAIPKILPKFFHQYVGNATAFQALKSYEHIAFVKYINSVYNLAPLTKWGLSIVPMVGVVTGSPSVEKIDFNTSVALANTGFIWTVYAMLIQPQNAGSRALALVNLCMGSVNGYNAYRRYQYDNRQQK